MDRFEQAIDAIKGLTERLEIVEYLLAKRVSIDHNPEPLPAPQPKGKNFIVFGENDYSYGQDMSCGKGIPDGIEFGITKLNDKKAILTADGYGGKPYGNGSLFVSWDIINKPEPEPAPL